MDIAREEFDRITKELMLWLDANCHPHTHIVVTSTHAELSEGIICNTNDELRD